MSHSTVLVVGDDPEKQLAPFDENLELPRYVRATKAQVIAKGRQEIEDYKNGRYAEYLADPEKYASETTNEGHLKYIREEFPKKLEWTDEQVYQDAIEYEEPENIGPDGEIYSTANDKARWDWYVLGGRWTGFFIPKQSKVGRLGEPGAFGNDRVHAGGVDQIRKGDIDWEAMEAEIKRQRGETWDKENAKPEKERWMWDFRGEYKNLTRDEYINQDSGIVTFAVLKDGQWYESGEMGWWGMVSDKKADEEWEAEWRKLIEDLPDDTLLSVYDVHI